MQMSDNRRQTTDISPAQGLFEAIRTLRSVREFRPDPVPDAVLHDIIEAATHAASARNAQPWYFVAFCDADLKQIGRAHV